MDISTDVAEFVAKIGVSEQYEESHDLIIMNALDKKRFDVLRYILEINGGKIELLSKNRNLRYLRLGHFCMTLGDLDILIFLAENKYDFNKEDFQGNTCLTCCARLGNKKMLEYMLKNTKINIFQINKNNYNVFHEVLLCEEIDSYWILRNWFYKKLLGTEKYSLFTEMLWKNRGKEGYTVLYISVRRGILEITKDIISFDEKIKLELDNIYYEEEKLNLLFISIRENNLEIVRFLVEEVGMDKYKKNKNGISVKEWAQIHSKRIYQYLKKNIC